MLLLSNRLAGIQKSDLRPNELKYVEENACSYTYFATLIRDGFLSTIAFKKMSFGRGKKKRELTLVKEACRWLAKTDEHYVCDFLSSPFMYNDWSVIFCDKDHHRHAWWRSSKPPRHGLKPWFSCTSKNYNRPTGAYLFGYEEFVNFMRKNVYRYFGMKEEAYERLKQRYDIAWFAYHYKKNLPASELFCKMGYPFLCFSKLICSMKPNKLKRFSKWITRNEKEIALDYGLTKRKEYGFNDLVYMFNHDMSVQQFEARRKAREIIKKFEERTAIRIGEAKAKEIHKYLFHQRYGYSDWELCNYIDYLEMKLKYGQGNLEERGTWFPRDYRQQHDSLTLLKNAKRTKDIDNGIAETMKKWSLPKEMFFKDGFALEVLDTSQKMVDVGSQLGICVGSCGYNERFSKGQCAILKLTKDGETMNCIELTPPKGRNLFKSAQNRGARNYNSKCQETSVKCVASYILAANKAYRLSQQR